MGARTAALRLAVLVPRRLALLIIACLLTSLGWVPPTHLPAASLAPVVTHTAPPGAQELAAPAVDPPAIVAPHAPRHSIDELLSARRDTLLEDRAEDSSDLRAPASWTPSVPTASPEPSPTPTTVPESQPPKVDPKPAKSEPKASDDGPPRRAKTEPKAPKTEPKAPEAEPKPPKTEPQPAPEPPKSDYSGTSRLWYPALGIRASWRWYGCEYGGSPDGLGRGVYRWGCVPKSNVYLMSHAWSTFEAVRRGYHSGAMRTGQSVWYADQGGDVTQWKVKWVKRVTLDHFQATMWEWAANDSASPIMTFQTCDGSNNQFRIIVRLVRDN